MWGSRTPVEEIVNEARELGQCWWFLRSETVSVTPKQMLANLGEGQAQRTAFRWQVTNDSWECLDNILQELYLFWEIKDRKLTVLEISVVGILRYSIVRMAYQGKNEEASKESGEQ